MRGLMFTRHHIDLIIAGRKTQTRRWIKDYVGVGEAKRLIKPHEIVYTKHHIYQSERESPALIQIDARRVQRLEEITREDAIAEGCPGGELDPIAWYVRLWDEINSKRCPAIKRPWVAAYTFHLVSVGAKHA